MNRALEGPRGFLLGFLAALVSAIIVLGGFLLALTEGGQRIAFLPALASPTLTGSVPSPDRTTSEGTSPPPPATPVPGQPTFTASPTPEQRSPLPPTGTPAATPTSQQVVSNHCAATPSDWIRITVGAGDTLQIIASSYNVDLAELAAANCLPPDLSGSLPAGSEIFIPPEPPTATAHPTATQKTKTTFVCSPAPSSWVPYVVKKGENLFRIALRYGVSTWTLQYYNCIPNPNRILAGQVIRVPDVTTITPTPSDTPPPTEIPTGTFTATSPPPTAVPPSPVPPTPIPATPTLTATLPPTATFTWTPSPTPQPSPTFTATLAPSATPSATPLPTSSPTVAPTAVAPTATDTLTPALIAPSGSPPPRPMLTP